MKITLWGKKDVQISTNPKCSPSARTLGVQLALHERYEVNLANKYWKYMFSVMSTRFTNVHA